MAISRRKKIVKVLLHVFGVLLFVFATSYALLAAYGYQIDLLHRNIVKTSIIDLVGEYKDVVVYSNDEQVSKKLPYQIKNIKPGDYKIQIKSDIYNEWSRTVEVIEDFVTIVDDIYLIPKDLTSYTKIDSIDFVYDDIVFNGNLLIFVNNEKGIIRKLNLGNEGMDFQTVTLLSPVSYTKLYPVGSRYIAFDNEDSINLFDISSNKFIEVLIPDEFTNFNLGYTSHLQGIYINNGSLFSVDISEEGTFNEITLLAERLQTEDLEVYSDGDFMFVKLDNDLYEYKDHLLTLIDSNVDLKPHLSPQGNKVLYLSTRGEIYVYSFEDLKRDFVGRFAKKIEYLGWAHDNKHIFIINNGNLLMCDLTMDNCPTIISDVNPETIFITQTKPLVVSVTKEGLSRIDLNFE